MSVNPITGVDYENDRFAVWRPSINDYTHTNTVWPRPDGGPRSGGLLFDYLYYKRVETERPVADHRFTVSTTWERVDADPLPPEGHPHGEYRQVHEVIKYDNETLKLQVEAEFQRQQKLIYPDLDNPAVLLEGAGALIQKSNSAPLTTDEQAKLDLLTVVANGLKQLRARQADLNLAIDNNEAYDITEGWIVA